MSERKACDMCGLLAESKETTFKWTDVRGPSLNWKDVCPACSKKLFDFIDAERAKTVTRVTA